eukprot:snap_masked-scaffold_18-processed-gene-2.19-mRNA-1 protein AED:1.00 eAED:1.00 QI:0/-1/0/0/-1/1/1/0/443
MKVQDIERILSSYFDETWSLNDMNKGYWKKLTDDFLSEPIVVENCLQEEDDDEDFLAPASFGEIEMLRNFAERKNTLSLLELCEVDVDEAKITEANIFNLNKSQLKVALSSVAKFVAVFEEHKSAIHKILDKKPLQKGEEEIERLNERVFSVSRKIKELESIDAVQQEELDECQNIWEQVSAELESKKAEVEATQRHIEHAKENRESARLRINELNNHKARMTEEKDGLAREIIPNCSEVLNRKRMLDAKYSKTKNELERKGEVMASLNLSFFKEFQEQSMKLVELIRLALKHEKELAKIKEETSQLKEDLERSKTDKNHAIRMEEKKKELLAVTNKNLKKEEVKLRLLDQKIKKQKEDYANCKKKFMLQREKAKVQIRKVTQQIEQKENENSVIKESTINLQKLVQIEHEKLLKEKENMLAEAISFFDNIEFYKQKIAQTSF